ncbi:MAG: P27 family phage terminase small subunit [Nitrospira sp.]|nr:P27 family phage terminase small subunit [Nitrospira sp.]
MKGRKPKDLALKLLTGNPGNRQLGSSDAAPFISAPLDKPDWLDAYASKEWDRLVSTLAPILSPASAGMVLIAVDAFSEWMRAVALIEKEGETYTTVNVHGQEMVRPRPEVVMRSSARKAYFQALSELGASPVAHTRVHKLPDHQTELPGIARLLG